MAWSPPESDTIVAPAAKGRNAARAWSPPADDLIVTARSRPVLDAYQAQLAETGLVDPMTESFESWQARRPDLDFVLSTTTTTGQATAQAKLPEGVRLVYCPFDLPFGVARALRRSDTMPMWVRPCPRSQVTMSPGKYAAGFVALPTDQPCSLK